MNHGMRNHCSTSAPTKAMAETRSAGFSILLSQYECLRSLCSNLSTIDMLNIGVTCREHYAYMYASGNTTSNLLFEAHCSGSRIRNQIQVSGYKPEVVRGRCEGGDALPCDKCLVNFCNVSANDIVQG